MKGCLALIVTLSLAVGVLHGQEATEETARANEQANATAKVATHYFYWYRWPKEHFKQGEGHFHHFKDETKVSYLDPDWHRDQFTAMAASGIDFALPVYWGAPGAYDFSHMRFSRAGLGPMVQALEDLEEGLEKDRAASVRLGLFYDTTTLLCDVREVAPKGGKPDLTQPAGKNLFCRTVIEYFEKIPRRFWARVDGRALVVLYSGGYAAKSDKSLTPALRAAFRRAFSNEDVFLVADASWGEIGQDRKTQWGAALNGPQILPGIAQIGPGYDDSPVPGRHTPRRDREDGNFYRWSWRRAIESKPQLVLLETWNEMHEGTEICETKETGRLYLDITREYVDRLRKGDPGPRVELRFPDVHPRRDDTWGSEAKGAKSVFVNYTGARPERFGLRERQSEDGSAYVRMRTLRPRGLLTGSTFVYFQIADDFLFDVDKRVEIVIDFEPVNGVPLVLEYDSRDATGDRFARAKSSARRGVGNARRVAFDLTRARFANRQNASADFRLQVADVRTAIRKLTVRIVD